MKAYRKLDDITDSKLYFFNGKPSSDGTYEKCVLIYYVKEVSLDEPHDYVRKVGLVKRGFKFFSEAGKQAYEAWMLKPIENPKPIATSVYDTVTSLDCLKAIAEADESFVLEDHIVLETE